MFRRPLLITALALLALAAIGGAPARASQQTILLELRGLDTAGLERAARERTDPASPRYRQWLTPRQVRYLYGSPTRYVTMASDAIVGRGLRVEADAQGASIEVTGPVEEIERLLGVDIVARRTKAGVVRSTVGDPVVPADLAPYVAAVIGLPGLGPRPMRAPAAGRVKPVPLRSGTPRGCDQGLAPGGFAPNQIRTLYGFDRLHRRGLRGAGMRIALFQFGAGLRRSTLQAFGGCFGIRAPRIRVLASGGARPTPDTTPNSVEAALDAQAVMIGAPGVERLDMLEAPADGTFGQLFAIALDPRRMGRLPHAISISYGICEPVTRLGPNAIADRRLVRFQAAAAAAMGIGVFASSGDDGSSACFPFTSAEDPRHYVAAVSWVASLPFVTAVGGTEVALRQDNTRATEATWNLRPYTGSALAPNSGGGGGASVLFRQPWYQRDAGIRSTRRVLPDVSMIASPVPGVAFYNPVPDYPGLPQGFTGIGGTSFAAPLLASAALLATERALRAGQERPGFLNPLLYTTADEPGLIFDVVEGTNDTHGIGCCRARPGYDAATGLGAPDVERLAAAVVAAGR